MMIFIRQIVQQNRGLSSSTGLLVRPCPYMENYVPTLDSGRQCWRCKALVGEGQRSVSPADHPPSLVARSQQFEDPSLRDQSNIGDALG